MNFHIVNELVPRRKPAAFPDQLRNDAADFHALICRASCSLYQSNLRASALRMKDTLRQVLVSQNSIVVMFFATRNTWNAKKAVTMLIRRSQ